MHFALAIVIKAVFLILLFGAARLVAMAVDKLMKPSKLKSWLFYDDGKFP